MQRACQLPCSRMAPSGPASRHRLEHKSLAKVQKLFEAGTSWLSEPHSPTLALHSSNHKHTPAAHVALASSLSKSKSQPCSAQLWRSASRCSRSSFCCLPGQVTLARSCSDSLCGVRLVWRQDQHIFTHIDWAHLCLQGANRDWTGPKLALILAGACPRPCLWRSCICLPDLLSGSQALPGRQAVLLLPCPELCSAAHHT